MLCNWPRFLASNNLLRSLVAGMGGSDMAQLAGWIGKEALAPAPAHFSGQPISVTPQVDPFADDAVLVIRNANGAEVDRRSVGVNEAAIQWDGIDADNRTVDGGTYSFDTISYADGQIIGSNSALTYVPVTEIRQGDGAMQIVLSGTTPVSVDQISGLRSPL